MAEEEQETVVIIKVEQGERHSGAWKVAYADFVTAMMAFFLLLWLLNVATDEQLKSLSDFFDPTHPKVSDNDSGAGGVLGGLSMSPQGAMSQQARDMSLPRPSAPTQSTQTHMQSPAAGRGKEELRKQEDERFKSAEELIKQAIREDAELAELAENLIIDMTPEGLRIQVVDQDGKPMFPSGSAKMYDKTRKLLEKVGGIVLALPNQISVRGHTDSVPYGKGNEYTNWELSSDRANSSRRVLLGADMPEERINNVMGKADTEHLDKDNPAAAMNRRISIILLREELTDPDYAKKAEAAGEGIGPAETAPAPALKAPPVGTFRKTPGQVQFP